MQALQRGGTAAQQRSPADAVGPAPRRRVWAAAASTSSSSVATPEANAAPEQRHESKTSNYASAWNLEQRRRRLAVKIFKPKETVFWERWELRMMELLDAQEAAQQQEAAHATDPEQQPGPAAAGEASQDDAAQQAAVDGGAWEAQAWSSYFASYDSPEVHLPGLRCAAYTRAWEEAIQHWGPTHIKGKVVLDLGCGPGLLSLLCAKAGAKRVIAVDGSKAMAEVAQQAALVNGLSQVIQVVHGRAEDLRLPERADVLVSDWPGPALLTGGMLRSVLHARRSLLKPHALVLPSSADVFVTGIEDKARLVQTKARFESVSGFDLTPAMARVVLAPRVGPLERASQLCTSTARVARVDWTGPLPPLRAPLPPSSWSLPASPFELECQRDERLFGLMLHFDLAWDGGGSGGDAADAVQRASAPPPFTTSPRAPATHLQQVTLTFPRSVRVQKGDVLRGSLAMELVAPPGAGAVYGRDLRITLGIDFKGVVAEAQYVLAHGVSAGAHAALLAEAL